MEPLQNVAIRSSRKQRTLSELSYSALSTFTFAGARRGTGRRLRQSWDTGGARTVGSPCLSVRGEQRAGAVRLAQARCAVVAVRRGTRVPACRAGVSWPPPRLPAHHGRPALPAPAAAPRRAVPAGPVRRAPEPGCLLRSREPAALREPARRCRYARPAGPRLPLAPPSSPLRDLPGSPCPRFSGRECGFLFCLLRRTGCLCVASPGWPRTGSGPPVSAFRILQLEALGCFWLCCCF